MKKLIGFIIATAAILAVAFAVQANSEPEHGEVKQEPTVSTGEETTPTEPATEDPTDVPTITPPTETETVPPVESTTSPSEETTKEDDGEREGYTADHVGKPGEAPKD